MTIHEKSVRGTISNRLKTKDQDPTKLDAAIENPNLQTVDVAALPASADTLKVSFTLRVLGGTGTPSACNNADYQAKLLATVKGYVDDQRLWRTGRAMPTTSPTAASCGATAWGPSRWKCRCSIWCKGEAASTWTFDALQPVLA